MKLRVPSSEEIEIALSSLAGGRRGISPICGASLAEAASVCISEAGHSNPAALYISGKHSLRAEITWAVPTRQIFDTWNDPEIATEQGACGIATLLVEQFGLEVIQRSRKGTGFDYWLGDPAKTTEMFQGLSRLEVSGIRSGNVAAIERRRRIKEKQTMASDDLGIPAVIAVVEFSTPTARITERCPE